jgi:hypothetical protein
MKWALLTVSFLFFVTAGAVGQPVPEKPSSGDLIAKAWLAHNGKDVEKAFAYTQQVIDLYGKEADRQQAALKARPNGKVEIEQVRSLNDVATAYFIRGESLMRQGKKDEAIAVFRIVIGKYSFAQAWDQFGWYWSVADKAQASIWKLEGKNPQEEKIKTKVSQLATRLALTDPGREEFVQYEKYGEFQNAGTADYRYVIKDQEGLSLAVGEGIYPNTSSVRFDPEFKKAAKEKRLDGNLWDFMQSPDLQAAFYKWATAPEPPGVRLYYTAMVLEKAGLIKSAIKAYYAIVIHYPGAYGWTYFKTPWYVGQAAISRINFLLRRNPQIGYRLADADIRIVNGFDNDVANDKAVVTPGKFVKVNGLLEKFRQKPSPESLSIRRRLGKGRVHLVQYETGDWQLLVDGKPYVIKGVTYAPTRVGESPHEGTLTNWMEDDFNKNGRIDGPYDAFVDGNRNNRQDPDEPSVGDFELMKEMGINTIRVYVQPGVTLNKELLRELYQKYGIRTVIGNYIGVYAIGSGAAWDPGTDYRDDGQKQQMLASVEKMVRDFKDEPFVLFWLLGNENVYGVACNAKKEPDAFYRFANDAAKLIKSIDAEHPVAIGNGDVLYLDKFAQDAPDIDIFGANAYRGESGFGFFWRQVKELADRPAYITEYGCSAYSLGKSEEAGEQLQAEYHQGSWEDIAENSAFGNGAGNALGSLAFEWLDEWWKGYEPSIHDKEGLWMGPFPDGYMHEEWLGVCGQGDGSQSPYLRQLRKAYYFYQKTWKK